jgi:hypothetical protein
VTPKYIGTMSDGEPMFEVEVGDLLDLFEAMHFMTKHCPTCPFVVECNAQAQRELEAACAS